MSTFSRTAASTNGNDVINGTTGNDTLKGLDGNDRLFGDRGRDRLLGGDGNDTLIGGGGNDYFKGGRGSDTADYSDQSVDMRIHLGSEFARFINRSWADETLKSIENIVAGSGNDDITGNDDSNLLQGGDGDDYLNGGKGKDTLEGGAGNDTLDGGGGTDLLDGGEGFDIADYSGLTSDVDVEFGDGWDTTSNIIFLGKSWNPETLVSIEGIWTGSGNDRIDASVFEWTAAEIDAGAGDDTIFGGESSDLLIGGDGNDVIYGSAGPSYTYDNYQYDTFNTSSDTLIGGDGDDTFYTSYGAKDVFDGGNGNDTIHLSWRHLNDFFYEYSDAWSNELEYVLGAGLYVDLSEEEDNVFYIRDITYENLPDAGESVKSIENVVLDDGNDYVIGTSGANEIRGGAGNDTLIGGKGRDKLVGGDGDDVLAGGGGTDTIRGGDGFDVADYSDVSADILADLKNQEVSFPKKSWKPELLDSIEGVYTGKGDDTLNGTGEDNMFDGGLGSDIIRGRKGIDTVSYASHDHGVDVNLANGVATNLLGNGGDFEDTLKSIENIIGGSGGDYIVGDSRSNRIDGGDGDDVVFGEDGNDIVVISKGYDQLFGGDGTDTLMVDFADEVIATTSYSDYNYNRSWDTSYYTKFDIGLKMDISRGQVSFDLNGEHSATFNEFEIYVGTTGTDNVTGSKEHDEIWVLGGDNTVRGRGGDDLIQGAGTYNDFAEQNTAFDSHPYGKAPFIGTYSSDELLYGGSGNDTIYGSGEIIGGSGDDELHAAGWYGSRGKEGFGLLSMEGGSGADKFHVPTSFEATGSDFSDGSALVVDITDFDASEGDKIVLAVGEINPEEDYQFEFIGEASAIDFRQAAYYREDDDLILQYDSGYYGGIWGELDHTTIRLTDYTGELTESDILLV